MPNRLRKPPGEKIWEALPQHPSLPYCTKLECLVELHQFCDDTTGSKVGGGVESFLGPSSLLWSQKECMEFIETKNEADWHLVLKTGAIEPLE